MREKGQSLVEMAIISPILILMLLGVFEVGAAIRTYMAVLNANREAARFAARGLYTDDQAYAHFVAVLSPDVPTDESNTTVYIRRFFVDTGIPMDASDDVYTSSLRVWGSLHPANSTVEEIAEAASELGNEVNVVLYNREVAAACASGLEPMRCTALMAFDFDMAPVDWHKEQFVYVEAHYNHEQVINFFGHYTTPLYTQTMMRIVDPRGY